MISAYLPEYLTPAAVDTAIPFNPQRYASVRDYGEVQWLQRDTRDANMVATAANPLPTPLDSAWQAGCRNWHTYVDAAGASARTWQSLQRNYISDPSMLGAASVMPAPATRTVTARDPGEVQWQQAPRRDPLLLTTAELENELLGGADTAKRYLAPATNAPRSWMPQQPKRDATTPGLLDAAELEGPLLAGDVRRSYAVAAYADRREMPQQRPYVSDPLLLTTAQLENVLLGGVDIARRYSLPAVSYDRRETVAQRPYGGDPSLLATAELENELLGGADALRRYYYTAATSYDRRQTVPQRIYQVLPVTALLEGVLLGGADMLRHYMVFIDRRVTVHQPGRSDPNLLAATVTDPLVLAWGAGGNVWHTYNRRSRGRDWWPSPAVFIVTSTPGVPGSLTSARSSARLGSADSGPSLTSATISGRLVSNG